jgi:hypothetical protein
MAHALNLNESPRPSIPYSDVLWTVNCIDYVPIVVACTRNVTATVNCSTAAPTVAALTAARTLATPISAQREVASRTPVHAGAGRGARQRASPTGARQMGCGEIPDRCR